MVDSYYCPQSVILIRKDWTSYVTEKIINPQLYSFLNYLLSQAFCPISSCIGGSSLCLSVSQTCHCQCEKIFWFIFFVYYYFFHRLIFLQKIKLIFMESVALYTVFIHGNHSWVKNWATQNIIGAKQVWLCLQVMPSVFVQRTGEFEITPIQINAALLMQAD